MKKAVTALFTLLTLFSFTTVCLAQEPESETITISGRVTDFDGHPVDGSAVLLLNSDFSPAYKTLSDADGYYRLENVRKGRYAAMAAMRLEEYPRENAVPEEDMRLEYWAWNVIADRDLEINPRYHKLELYGLTVFEEYGGMPFMMVYFRPMSVTKYISYEKAMYLDKGKMEQAEADLTVPPEHLRIEVYAGDKELRVHSVHALLEDTANGYVPTSYLAWVKKPKIRPGTPYVVFRVVATNTEFDETGENAYFYEPKKYEKQQTEE